MPQKLALPINKCTITAMYKTDSPGYHEWDTTHYGVDMTGSVNPFYASGNGTVVDVGGSATTGVGFWAAIRYNDVYKWNSSSPSSLTAIGDVIVRYFHLKAKPSLTKGQAVTLDTAVGTYANTGGWTMGNHLHVEVDTDVKNPLYTPTLGSASGGLQAGARNDKDTTIDPMTVFFRKTTAPESQTITYSQSYCAANHLIKPANTTRCSGGLKYINTAKVTTMPTRT